MVDSVESVSVDCYPSEVLSTFPSVPEHRPRHSWDCSWRVSVCAAMGSCQSHHCRLSVDEKKEKKKSCYNGYSNYAKTRLVCNYIKCEWEQNNNFWRVFREIVRKAFPPSSLRLTAKHNCCREEMKNSESFQLLFYLFYLAELFSHCARVFLLIFCLFSLFLILFFSSVSERLRRRVENNNMKRVTWHFWFRVLFLPWDEDVQVERREEVQFWLFQATRENDVNLFRAQHLSILYQLSSDSSQNVCCAVMMSLIRTSRCFSHHEKLSALKCSLHTMKSF